MIDRLFLAGALIVFQRTTLFYYLRVNYHQQNKKVWSNFPEQTTKSDIGGRFEKIVYFELGRYFPYANFFDGNSLNSLSVKIKFSSFSKSFDKWTTKFRWRVMNTEKYFNGAEEWDRWTLLSKTFFIIEGRKKNRKEG